MAYADAGDFAAAEALEAKAQSFSDIAAQRQTCIGRLELFRARKAYREPDATNVLFDDSKPSLELKY